MTRVIPAVITLEVIQGLRAFDQAWERKDEIGMLASMQQIDAYGGTLEQALLPVLQEAYEEVAFPVASWQRQLLAFYEGVLTHMPAGEPQASAVAATLLKEHINWWLSVPGINHQQVKQAAELLLSELGRSACGDPHAEL